MSNALCQSFRYYIAFSNGKLLSMQPLHLSHLRHLLQFHLLCLICFICPLHILYLLYGMLHLVHSVIYVILFLVIVQPLEEKKKVKKKRNEKMRRWTGKFNKELKDQMISRCNDIQLIAMVLHISATNTTSPSE